MAVESGIAPSVLENEHPAYLDAMADHLIARANPDSADDVDWDETYGGD